METAALDMVLLRAGDDSGENHSGVQLSGTRPAPRILLARVARLPWGGKGLWDKYDNGDNLLFVQQDFETPTESLLMAELLKLNDPVVRRLVEKVIEACKRPLDQAPLLEDLASEPPKAEMLGA